MRLPPPSFDHILAISDRIGTFEHADHTERRVEHGYCTDDMARLLVVLTREPDPAPALLDLARRTFRFVAAAQAVTGAVRNRRAADGRWEDRHAVEDCWGRSLWAFGTAAGRAPEPWLRQAGLACFERGTQQRSPWPRAAAFAALGAAEVLAVHPHHAAARAVLADAAVTIGRPAADPAWPWPEPRLTYANAVLPEALLATGAALGRPDVVDDGRMLLRWLLERETLDGHLSPTPAGGAGRDDALGRFDQQPIEVAAMADACARAAEVTGDSSWLDGVDLAARWFAGDNDTGSTMWDPATGGGYDGLHARGPNRNQGAESTLALLSTLQHARTRALASTSV